MSHLRKLCHLRMALKISLWTSVFWFLQIAFISGAINSNQDGPSFTIEPDETVEFSNNTGKRLECQAKGNPPPNIRWLLSDGSPVTSVPGLRQVTTNGLLEFPPFKAENYRQDVHAVAYKCSASNVHGTIVSKDIKLKAVINQMYEVYVYDSFVIKGNTGIMKCHVPIFLAQYIRVISWLRDDRYVINNTDFHRDNKYVIAPNGDLYIRDVDGTDQSSTYRCQIIHRLTNATKISSYQGKLIVADPSSNVGPNFITKETDVKYSEGSNVVIPCSAQGNPPPTIKWFRNVAGHLQSIENKQKAGVLIINSSHVSDSGQYICQAENTIKKEKMQVTVKVEAPLKVFAMPKTVSANVGSAMTLRCEVSGLPAASIVWLRNGKTVSSEAASYTSNSLTIDPVTSAHKGMYQCIAKNDEMSAYDVVQVRLGDTPPEFTSTFEEQVAEADSFTSLLCSATGSPLPKITWMLDSIPVSNNRVKGQTNGQVTSWLNISSIRPEEGGVYSCIANNKAGSQQHSARINVLGPLTSRRQVPKLSSVAGQNVEMYCPVYGYPFTSVTWSRGDITLPTSRRERVWENGTLDISNVQSSLDSGLYTCIVKHGDKEVKGSAELVVMVPPKILPFSFQEELLREGMRARIQCVVSEGDLPMSIEWTKDDLPIPKELEIVVRDLDDYSSILSISTVTPKHNGRYTCAARNDATTASHSAILAVNVPPKIIPFTFQDDQFFKGMRAHIICAVSQGDLPIRFQWLKNDRQIPSSIGISTRNYDGYTNSLSIDSVSSAHTGNYTCVASNRAANVSYTAQLLVYVTPKISPFAFQEDSKREGSFARVTCLIYQGDLPITLTWQKDNLPIHMNYGITTRTIDEYSSILTIEKVETKHSGNYTCSATNAADTVSYTAQLIVNVPPKIVPFTFQDDHLLEGMLVRVSCVVSRGDLPLTLTWLKEDEPISTQLNVVIRDFDEYSSVLSIDPLTVKHSGTYTCVAQNHAGSVKQSATLTVNVPPRWLIKPTDQKVLLDEELIIDCKAEGFPTPTIKWKKVLGKSINDDDKEIIENYNTEILTNGSLKFHKVTLQEEGYYTCYATNGVGVELSTTITVTIHAPAYFKTETTSEIAVKVNEVAVLTCEAFGDQPIYFQWTFKQQIVDPLTNSKYKLHHYNNTNEKSSVSELTIDKLQHIDNGIYVCSGKNIFGNDSHNFKLTVQVVPSSPEITALRNLGNRSVEISWSEPHDGNSPITKYSLQYKRKQDSWVSRSVILPFENRIQSAIVKNLHPATIYEFRVSAENEVGPGDQSNVVTVVLGEEAPEGPPQQVEVEAVDPQTLRLSWKPPKKNLWNGVIRGYYVGNKVHGSHEPYSFSELEVPEDYVEDLIYQLTNLNMYTQYSIIVQAYNNGGRGPSSEEIITMTSEDIPSQPPQGVRCSSLSSHSIYVIWDSPPSDSIHGILRGYKVLYKPLEPWYDGSLKVNVTATPKLTLTGLEVDANYSIEVSAFTKLGDGTRSEAVFCKTYEDVPGSPDAIKALPMSENSVLISWKPPSKPNGAITKYNVYYTPVGDGEEHKDFANKDDMQGVNFQTLDSDTKYFEIKGLSKNNRYAFWVTALSAIGESPISSVLTQVPATQYVPAKLASFDDEMKTHWKVDLTLPCRAVGIPTPERKWFHRGKSIKENDHLLIRYDGTLVIRKSDKDDNGNYTCRVTNKFGSDEVHYKINVVVPPGSPILDVLSKSLTSVRLRWRNGFDGGEPIHGYVLHFKRDLSQWERKELASDIHTYTLENLACGSTYQLYLEAINNVGTGNPCEVITVTTNGEAFQLPPKESLVEEGVTFVTVHFDSWPSSGCPVQHFVAEYKRLDSSEWKTASSNIKSNQKKFVISGLSPSTWHVLRLTAYTTPDDFNIGEYIFATLTLSGGTIAPDIVRSEEKVILFYLDPWIFIPVVILLIIGIITAVVVFLYCKRRTDDHRKSPEEPVDWTQYMGTLAKSHRELGVSVESFVPMAKGPAGATLHRNGTMWRNGNEPNPYATIRLPGYSEMTMMRGRQELVANPHRVHVTAHPDGWVQVLPTNTALINLHKSTMSQGRWPADGTYGPVVGPGKEAVHNKPPSNSSSNATAQETTFTFPPEEKSNAVNAKEAMENPSGSGITINQKDSETQDDTWLLDKQDLLK